ncbi:MAG: caspase family protein [Bacteroidaceae bacterium]|nr:caspase family protein [Bacteroidaceae bacterium]
MTILKALFLSFALSCVAIRATATTYLVAVGVSDYPGTANDLSLPANDAATIQFIYDKNSNAETVLLTNGKATKSAVLEALRTLFAKAKEDDIIIFFFSGHGTKGAFCAYDTLIKYSEIRSILAASKAGSKMIFADACFSGKMRGARKHSPGQAFRNHNIMLFLSSRDSETSIERRDMKNGFFTSCLQRGLRGGADANRDRIITAKELFSYVSTGVKNLSGDRQHPVMWGKFSDNMTVMKW